MKLNDFEHYVDKAVVARGLGYFRENRVELLDCLQDGLFEATVAGNDDYTVEVELDAQCEIVTTDCDCPYTGGPVCKHMVAVFFALRQAEKQTSNEIEPSLKKLTAATHPLQNNSASQMEQALSGQSKEKLVKFLLGLAEDNPIVSDLITAEFIAGPDEKEKWVRLMTRYIERAADEHGFIDYRNCSQAVEGAEKVIERAQTAIDEEDYVFAVELALCVMGEMVDLLDHCDDSDGEVGSVIGETIDLLNGSIAAAPAGAISGKCFLHILNEAKQSRYQGWSDWRIILLNMCAELTVNPQLRELLEQYLGHISPETQEKEPARKVFSENYLAEAVTLIRHELIQKFDGKSAADLFLWEHRGYSRCRSLALKNAMTAKDYAKAEMLALEGEQHDQDFPGLVRQWKELRFEIYQKDNQLDKMRDISHDLIFRGEFTYYQKLKESYKTDEWAQLYPDILEKLAKESGYNRNMYTSAVIEEKEWSKLLEHVRKNPYDILSFYRHLLTDYRKQVYELFNNLILQESSRSSNRSAYRNVCDHLRLLAKIGGSQETAELVKKLMLVHARKPAFLDELKKVRV
ncbi:MAG: SWIM zinc finger family protein [Negativicutes bacterium]